MSIPTNNLYNFVTQALENKYLIKYFHPWGHKDFVNIVDNEEDNRPTYNYTDMPVLICHDQEPLDFELYNDINFNKQIDGFINSERNSPPGYIDRYKSLKKAIDNGRKNLNLRWADPANKTEYWTLLHSELNSPQVIQYESTGLFKCAYWWAHAPIAIDWYRFAQYDNRLKRQTENIKANFLVYARATTGKRAYRKIFLNHLAHIDSIQLGSIRAPNIGLYKNNSDTIDSESSATYDAYDFAHTNCSIILETVYDQRIHLTEKTLRPLACGHPFMILSGPGALDTIREYGFKTFQPYINESYDQEQGPMKRMDMVLKEMSRINNASEKYQQWIWDGCAKIAEYNKKLFFDDKFIWRVKTELRRTVRTV
jgi:hypothetical protein